MALLTYRAPVNYDEQQGMFVRIGERYMRR